MVLYSVSLLIGERFGSPRSRRVFPHFKNVNAATQVHPFVIRFKKSRQVDSLKLRDNFYVRIQAVYFVEGIFRFSAIGCM